MLNHRESVTVSMVLHMHKRRKNKYLDSLESSLCNWIAIEIFSGLRMSECAQDVSHKTQPLAGPESLPLAFILTDLIFLGADRSTVPSHGRRNCRTLASNSSNSDG